MRSEIILKIKRIFQLNIKTKLILSLLSVILITGIGSMIFSIISINRHVLGQAYDAVQIQLNNAKHIYNKQINVIHLFINHLASLDYLQEAISARNKHLLNRKLNEVKKELGIDIINITDERGKIIQRTNNPLMTGDDIHDDLFIKYVLKNRKSCFGTDIISKENLIKESKTLVKQAYIKVIPTPKARKREKLFEDSGLVLKAASPVFLDGKFIAVIYGAKLLNNNFEITDRIKSLVFKDEKLNGFDVGTATIFQGDIRVSTNVKNKDGTRAIGTQVSEEVYSSVFEQGKLWLDKAFVVNNWYISGYSPIRDIDQKVLGILYVGILEDKYDLVRRDTSVFLIAMILITSLMAVFLSFNLIRSIINPINTIVEASNGIAQGDYTNKISITSEDEMGHLCNTFNKMIDAIALRDNMLKEHTQLQIIRSEKLASLGRLASGMAHEVNNPLTGVLSYSTVLYDELKDTQYGEDLKIIINETIRCREIVKTILDFARETKLEKKTANLNTLISDVLTILGRHIHFQNIEIQKHLEKNLPYIDVDVNQIISVINNLAVNAADAMHNNGTLTVKTKYDQEHNEIIIEISDTGTGISEKNLSKIFDPFFTTKESGKGTGLGLSVTYGIIERHNGWIDVKSKLGEGSTFTVGLPVK